MTPKAIVRELVDCPEALELVIRAVRATKGLHDPERREVRATIVRMAGQTEEK